MNDMSTDIKELFLSNPHNFDNSPAKIFIFYKKRKSIEAEYFKYCIRCCWIPSFWELCCWFLPKGGVVEPFISNSWRRRQMHMRSIFNLLFHLRTELPSAGVRVFLSSLRNLDFCGLTIL